MTSMGKQREDKQFLAYPHYFQGWFSRMLIIDCYSPHLFKLECTEVFVQNIDTKTGTYKRHNTFIYKVT